MAVRSRGNRLEKLIGRVKLLAAQDRADGEDLLIGTPEEVKRELRSRLEELGITYYVVFPASQESRELLASEVMPAFSS